MPEPDRPVFLDSSVVVRYLTNDPPDMARRAAEIIDSNRPLVLTELILAESGYVLASVYEIPRPALVDALMGLVRRTNIRTLGAPKPLVLDALQLCRDSGRYSFADVLLWAEARAAGAERIFSFDRRFPDSGIEVTE